LAVQPNDSLSTAAGSDAIVGSWGVIVVERAGGYEDRLEVSPQLYLLAQFCPTFRGVSEKSFLCVSPFALTGRACGCCLRLTVSAKGD
ncbi:hypothetical protein, partial [Corynebacterium aurimucosum]|uniref:hypothetical protein n=1 Tax=Corynebacterium aurimucosum TaxID=169292 RepID=UPI001B7F8626